MNRGKFEYASSSKIAPLACPKEEIAIRRRKTIKTACFYPHNLIILPINGTGQVKLSCMVYCINFVYSID